MHRTHSISYVAYYSQYVIHTGKCTSAVAPFNLVHKIQALCIKDVYHLQSCSSCPAVDTLNDVVCKLLMHGFHIIYPESGSMECSFHSLVYQMV